VTWIHIWIIIRIKKKSWSVFALNKNQDPDPDQSDKLDPDMHQLADDKPKCMEYESFLALYQGFEPLFGS
jgi:hypothetical protein